MERIDDLQIKGLHIIQDTDLFMFGTDSVLLADFARIKKNARVLDIGTGTGVICFLLYGRQENAFYTGIDIQPRSIELANKSKALNKIDDRIEFICTDLKDFTKKDSYDTICINPPYERLGTGFIGGNSHVMLSRYETAAALKDIIECAARNLKPKGKLFMIYKAERIGELTIALSSCNLELKAIRTIQKNPFTPPRLVLIEAIKGGSPGVKWHNPLIMYEQNGQPTKEMRRIYSSE